MTRKEFEFFIGWAAIKAKLALLDCEITHPDVRCKVDEYIMTLIDKASNLFNIEESYA